MLSSTFGAARSRRVKHTRNRPRVAFILRAFAFAIAALAALLVVGCARDPSIVELSDAEYQRAERPDDAAWLPAQAGSRLPLDPRPIWFRIRPPPLTAPDAALRLSWGHTVDEVTVDGRAVPIVGSRLIVPLEVGAATVLVRQRGGEVDWIPHFVVGPQRALWAEALIEEVPTAVVGGTMVLAGLLLLGASLRRGGARAYRGLGLFLGSLGGITLLNLRQLSELYPITATPIYYLHHVLTCLYPLGFAEFALATFGDGGWQIIRRGLRVYGGFLVVIWALHFAHLASLRDTRDLVGVFIIAFCGQAIVLAARRARQGDSAGKAFLFGISVLLFFGLFDLWPAVNAWQTLPIGLLGFAIAMAVVLERQFAQARDATQVTARELAVQVETLQQRNRDIQELNIELRHQIAERSRQMVQLVHTGMGALGESRALQTGEIVGGRYRVVRTLGQGGMGAVYEVDRLTDMRHFALKIMCGFPTAAAAARFAREAEIAARIVDDNLVAVADVGGADTGELYFVMELVSGRSLEEARAVFGNVSWAVPILAQVASGLAALHAAGVVHRDLKPGNVLLSVGADGVERAKIADFGISHLASVPLPERGSTPDIEATNPQLAVHAEAATMAAVFSSSPSGNDATVANAGQTPPSPKSSGPQLTATGIIMGTPAYMAPEAVGGARSTRPASDMFAFGLIAYEMLAGRPAFDTAPGVLAMARKELPPVLPLPGAVGQSDLGALVEACLRIDPDERPTVTEAVLVLRRSLAATTSSTKAHS